MRQIIPPYIGEGRAQQYILPDSRFEMPELFIPGKQPIASVRINQAHILSKVLDFCFIPGVIVLGVNNEIISEGSFVRVKNGRQVQNYVNDEEGTTSTNTVNAGDTSFTILSKTKFNDFNGVTFGDNPDNNGALICNQRGVSYDLSPTLCVSDTSFANGTGTSEDFRLWFGVDTNAVAYGAGSTLELYIDKFYSLGGRYDNTGTTGIRGGFSTFVNGEDTTYFGDSAGVKKEFNGNYFYIGWHPNWPSASIDNANQDMEYLFRFASSLSNQWIKSITDDPYQFLEPA